MGMDEVIAWLDASATTFAENAEFLDQLDTAIGDGDHGTNMERGFRTASELHFEDGITVTEALKRIGMAMVSSVGGSAGPLFGTLFLRIGQYVGPTSSLDAFARAVDAGINGIVARGKARPGDATMLDALLAAQKSFSDAASRGATVPDAFVEAAAATRRAAEETAPMVARRGRAAQFGDASVGHVDPGAMSVALMTEAAAEAVRPAS